MARTDVTAFGPHLLRIGNAGEFAAVINAQTITHVAEVGGALHVHHAGGWIVLNEWTQDEFAEVWEECCRTGGNHA